MERQSSGRTIVARAPNHLGDGVLALPALEALARVGDLVVTAPAWGRELYRDLRVEPIAAAPTGDVAVLFPPSFRVAWEARRFTRRIGVASDARGFLLTDRVTPGVHRGDTYAALANALGARVNGPPTYRLRTDDPRTDVPEGHLGCNPVSVSGAVVEWTGFLALARRIGLPVVFYGGPGEQRRVAAIAGSHEQRVGLSLPAFASALSRCAVFVSNDSGAAHFARACGTPTVVVHGSTTAARTGAHGAFAVEGPELHCRPCYRKTCRYELECLRIPVDAVERAVREALGG